MHLTSEFWGQIGVIRPVGGRLDAAIASSFRDDARTLITKQDPTKVWLVDLSKTGFIDSSGVGALVGLLKFVGHDRRFELCGMSATVHRVFKLTRLDTVFQIHPALADGLEAHGAGTAADAIKGHH